MGFSAGRKRNYHSKKNSGRISNVCVPLQCFCFHDEILTLFPYSTHCSVPGRFSWMWKWMVRKVAGSFSHLISEYMRLHNHHLGLNPFQCEWSQWASISLACQIWKCVLWRAKIIHTNHHAHTVPCGHFEYQRWVGWFEEGQFFSNALAFAVMVLWIIIHTDTYTLHKIPALKMIALFNGKPARGIVYSVTLIKLHLRKLVCLFVCFPGVTTHCGCIFTAQ